MMNDLIEAHLESLKDQRLSPTTIKLRRRILYRAHHQLPQIPGSSSSGLDSVYAADITTYLDNPGWNRWTPHTYFGHLVGFYRWAFNEGLMSADPTYGMKAPPAGASRPKPVLPAELEIAFRLSCEPWYTTIWLGVGAGLRASEMATIRREDITEERVHVRWGKGGKERYVDTAPQLWQFVCNRPAGLLVRRPDGRPVNGGWLSAKQNLHWRSIGLPGWHLHRLRHTFCTTMWQAGNDPLAIRDLMGHTSVTTTQRYAEAAREAYRKAVAAVDALLREHQPDGSRLVPSAAA